MASLSPLEVDIKSSDDPSFGRTSMKDEDQVQQGGGRRRRGDIFDEVTSIRKFINY